ncbi:hypothetical protein [Devosia sp. RR2S18]|uniref:hypothetical protein n=1 Tax=Devosia rhizosphaerae TaxID=3049774 RepID=UPI002541BB15|nr:hypothetical protein [Devosia sp. RR2S18]WIJ26587.1 hypothetical protein QOV41_07505 [Devosia sp. RR2S18]
MKLITLTFALLTVSCTPAFAWICSEPSSPYCADSYGPFSDGYDFENCKREMEDYGEEVEQYLDCLSTNSQAAIDEYNDAVEAFNRRAGGY